MRTLLIHSWVLAALLFVGSAAPTHVHADPPASTSSAPVSTREFNAATEFPNYFLPEQYRGVLPERVPIEVVQSSRRQIEAAMASVFRRMTVLVQQAGSEQLHEVRYFDQVQARVHAIDPAIRVMPSGGVVRSLQGYLYQQVYEGMHEVPPVAPEETLRRIATATADIRGNEVRGIGSDFDLLIEAPSPDLFERAKTQILAITPSAETAGVGLSPALQRTIFLKPDVRPYSAHTDEAVSQGGSTLDYLAFDVTQGRLVEPESVPGVVDDLILGRYSYVAPRSPRAVRDPAKQTVRGIRPLLELPYLRMRDSTRFDQEIRQMIQQARVGPLPSEAAMEQFNRMVRNARFSGANNRFYRARRDSTDALIRELSDVIRERSPSRTRAIPEFVDRFVIPPGGRTGAIDRSLLVSVEEFIARNTHQGVLYHGTKQSEGALSISRGGLWISDRLQGLAAYGRGGYSTGMRSEASSRGLVFEMEVRRDLPLRIVDWQRVKDTVAMRRIRLAATAQGRDVFEVLARDYGIDIIVNGHVLIQNIEAVRVPQGLSEAVRTRINELRLDVMNRNSDMRRRLHAYEEVNRLRTQMTGIVRPEDLTLEEMRVEDLRAEVIASLSYDRSRALNTNVSASDRVVLFNRFSHLRDDSRTLVSPDAVPDLSIDEFLQSLAPFFEAQRRTALDSSIPLEQRIEAYLQHEQVRERFRESERIPRLELKPDFVQSIRAIILDRSLPMEVRKKRLIDILRLSQDRAPEVGEGILSQLLLSDEGDVWLEEARWEVISYNRRSFSTNPQDEVRPRRLSALERQRLMRIFRNENSDNRRVAAVLAGWLEVDDVEIQRLLASISMGQDYASGDALRSLALIRPTDPRVRAILASTMVHGEHAEIRQNAARALITNQPIRDVRELEALRMATEDAYESVRQVAAEILQAQPASASATDCGRKTLKQVLKSMRPH